MASRLNAQLEEYGDVLTAAGLAQFLATQHWTIQRDRQFDQTWIHTAGAAGYLEALQLPRDSTLVDYDRRLLEAVETVSEVYGWTFSQLAEQVASVKADLFFVRVDQHGMDGTIPLRQASALLENIDQMIRSAAVVAYNPHSSGRGRQSEVVSDFLQEDLRMGHTKKGSFIITVAARIEEGEHWVPRNVEPPPGGTDQAPSFARQVMTTLSRSLQATKRAALREESSEYISFDDAVGKGMRLPLVQALEEMGQADGLRALDMSFEWAPIERIEADVPTEIKLTQTDFRELPDISQRLRRTPENRLETLVGQVIELKRAEGSDSAAESGEIVVRADVDGRSVKVTVPLSGKDYDWAIRAHRAHAPFTVSGELGKKSNSWRLLNEIEVDTSYLEHRFGEGPAVTPA